MLELLLSNLKVWIAAGGAAVVAVFVAIYKYRGDKIETLKDEVQKAKNNAEVKDKQVKADKKRESFEADNRVAEAKAVQEVTKKDIEDVEHKFYSI